MKQYFSNLKALWNDCGRDILLGGVAGMVCAVLIFLLSGCSVAYCMSDTGDVYGSYDLSDVTFDYPGSNFRYDIPGTVVLDGVSYDFVAFGATHSIPVSSSNSYWIEGSDGTNISLATGRTWNYSSIVITFDETFKISVISPWGEILSSAFWLSAPEPFPDAITSALTAVVSSLGGVLSAVSIANGSLSALLPLLGISIALSIALLVFLLIKRSSKF